MSRAFLCIRTRECAMCLDFMGQGFFIYFLIKMRGFKGSRHLEMGGKLLFNVVQLYFDWEIHYFHIIKCR